MIKHNLKLVLRNLWKRRIYSFVILLSLTIAFACSNLLILVHETRTDAFHSKHERIFQIFSDDPFEARGQISFIPKSFANYAASHYPEIQDVCQIDRSGTGLASLIPQLQVEWKKLFPDDYFDYQIIQSDLMKKYKNDIFIYKIVVSFSVISVLLSCIGLFALSWAMVQSRTKEIGIRKVVGATYTDVVNLLTWSFTKRIALAFFVASPIGYYLMDRWLMAVMKRITLDLSVFALSALVMVAVSALALSVQTVKAALTNPVDEIRNE